MRPVPSLVALLLLATTLACTGQISGFVDDSNDGPEEGDRDAGTLADRPDAALPAQDGKITIDGRRLLVGGQRVEIRGVCWNPIARGKQQPADFVGFATQDVELMKAAGINAVRTYDAITDRAVLDKLHAAGIHVLMTVYAYGGDPEGRAVERVNAIKDHPAILMWLVGNEWNYNGLYTGLPFGEVRDRLQRIAAAIHAADPTRPVATIYGELPAPDTIAAMPDVDVWGINSYRGLSFGDLFTAWAARSGKPMFMSEYGADAWDARGGGAENPSAQADATGALTGEILATSTARKNDGIALGGTIFAWSDEWWKDGAGSADVHDIGGIAPGGGPYPDQTFNEEWWGIVDIDRRPRPAYERLKQLFKP